MILDLLRQRFSCRRFSARPISEDVLRYILECGRLSASGGNEQPWKFGVISDPQIIRDIAAAASVNYNQKWIETAPLLIVLCTKVFDSADDDIKMNRFPSLKDKLKKIDHDVYAAINMEEHQTKIPGEHMVLAALEHGIYGTWISSMDCERVGEIISLQGYLVSNVIAFGYPAQSRKKTAKKALNDLVFKDRFDHHEPKI